MADVVDQRVEKTGNLATVTEQSADRERNGNLEP